MEYRNETRQLDQHQHKAGDNYIDMIIVFSGD